jgi:cholesterol transport system auxiliary component
MNGKIRLGRLAVLGMIVACLAGCLGKPPPVERYLRVRLEASPCQGEANQDRVALGMKALKALDNLDRSAVLTARDRVLTPSLQFYWEGSPIDIVGQALRQGIECQSTRFAPVDYQPRVAHEGVLTGQITAFNVEETNGGRFTISLHLELWSKNSGARVSVGDFNAYAPLENFEGDTVARAATDALGRIVPKVVAWLDDGREKLEKANRPQ